MLKYWLEWYNTSEKMCSIWKPTAETIFCFKAENLPGYLSTKYMKTRRRKKNKDVDRNVRTLLKDVVTQELFFKR